MQALKNRYRKSGNKNHVCLLMVVGLILIFTTYCKKNNAHSLTDIEGHVYRTVIIGKYEWMAENLKTTKYNDGEKIPNIVSNSIWKSLNSGAFTWYYNDINNADTFGILYNWYAVNTGKLCPCGWHVPSDEEWKYLEGYVDMKYGIGNPIWDNEGLRGYNAGLRLKTISGWRVGINGTDNFGFSGIPGGEYLSKFIGKGSSGFWWTSTENDSSTAWYRNLTYSFAEVSRNYHPKKIGFSVRCIRKK